MSRCVVAFPACPVPPELAGLLRADDFIIACDAGYQNCARLGRRPDIIVGDFDSAPCPPQTGEVVVLPARQGRYRHGIRCPPCSRKRL